VKRRRLNNSNRPRPARRQQQFPARLLLHHCPQRRPRKAPFLRFQAELYSASRPGLAMSRRGSKW
jgi:hypothetical protein